MEKAVVWGFGENFIVNLAGLLLEKFADKNCDLSRVACVFGGRRPALFLRRELLKKIGKAFYPPRFFSIDQFTEYILSGEDALPKIGDLDASFLIYRILKKYAPAILKKRGSFSGFLPWAYEIISFIEQLDLEAIQEHALKGIQASAAIGYDVPESINLLLRQLSVIRDAYHSALDEKEVFSRGIVYLRAAQAVRKKDFAEFDAVLFCNFFYLHRTEIEIIKSICRGKKGVCIFQGDEEDWPVIKNNLDSLGIKSVSPKKNAFEPKFFLYAAFDLHSQICTARKILKKIKKLDETVIVLPRPQAAVPLLSEIASQISEFNLSLGYPLRRSAVFSLLKKIAGACESKKGRRYYTKDYLSVLRHPLVKNMKLFHPAAVTRVLIHKIEEELRGGREKELGGNLFIGLDAVEESSVIYSLSRDTLKNMGISVARDELISTVRRLHQLLFRCWEKAENFFGFTACLDQFIAALIDKSALNASPLNLKVLEKLHSLKEEFRAAAFAEQPFLLGEIWAIFMQKLEKEVVSFTGSPLKGLQILGLFETRSLNFKNVIFLDLNESSLPKLKIYEPLIPREVMLGLGLNRLEKEEEIQRYQFMRLLSCADNAYLIYEENQEKEKSRFIEELLWKRQKESRSLEAVSAPKVSFRLTPASSPIAVKKTAAVIDFLKKGIFSASKVNAFLSCPLKFYHRYVLGLSEAEDSLDEPGAGEVGTFIHELLEEAFKKFINQRPLIDKKFRRVFFRIFDRRFKESFAKRMRSDSLLLRGVMENRLEKFLEKESKRSFEKIICLEKEFESRIKLSGLAFKFICRVDRIDQCTESSAVIIDYKTGRADKTPKRLAALEEMTLSRTAIRETIKSFQLPLYYFFIKEQFPSWELNAELYSVRTLERKPFISEADYPYRERIMSICLKSLEFIFSQMLDPSLPFAPDREERKCGRCEFNCLCR